MKKKITRSGRGNEARLLRQAPPAVKGVARGRAGPKVAWHSSDAHPAEIALEVGDEGKGMRSEVLASVRGAATPVGVGVAGMREGLWRLGGRLDIGSSSRGTTVRVVLPVE